MKSPAGRRKRPTITQVCEWVKKSWDAVKEEIIVKSFKKCGISNALDRTEDNMVYEESSDEEAVDDVAAMFEDDTRGDSNNNFLGFEKK